MMRAHNQIVTISTNHQSRNTGRRRAVLAAATTAAIAGLGLFASRAHAATLTWTGATVDNTGTSVNGAQQPSTTAIIGSEFNWTTSATNWSGGTYAVGSDVVFTDAAAPGKNVRLST